MAAQVLPAEVFEEHRGHLRAVAYRMLGSAAEADDAVQDAWLRAADADASEIREPRAWLTTVVARVCLNALRTRRLRAEEPLVAAETGARAFTRGSGGGAGGTAGGEPAAGAATSVRAPAVPDPAQEAELAESVGLALMVVLNTLGPAERLAFVLHDMFAVPFGEIAPLLERSPAAVRQLASRARRRVTGADRPLPAPAADLARQRRAVAAYLAAAREGDFRALLPLLHPDVVLHADAAAAGTPAPRVLRGAHQVARGAAAASVAAPSSALVLIDGHPGLVAAPGGRVAVALRFVFAPGAGVGDAAIRGIDVVAEPARLAALRLALPASGVTPPG